MKFNNIRVFNFQGALRGMRNPKNSWDKSDSSFGFIDATFAEDVDELMKEFNVFKEEMELMEAKRLKDEAIKKDKLDLLGTISQTCQIITRKSDYDKLNKNQKLIFEKDILSCEIYSLATNKQLNPFEMKIVE